MTVIENKKYLQMSNVLYISYDGILEPLGYSQVWSYLSRLSNDRKFFLISFEKKVDFKDTISVHNMKDRCKKAGIIWIPLRYHKTPSILATLYDILLGTIVGAFIVLRNKISIVHARSYIPALMALFLKKIFRLKFIFDMRGLWADEKADSGIWKKDGLVFKFVKGLEKYFLLNAEIVISLTHKAVEEIKNFPYLKNTKVNYKVITTCADLDIFSLRNKESNNKPFTLGYVGSVSLWYAFEEVLLTFKLLLQIIPEAKLCIINKGEHELINQSLIKADLKKDNVNVVSSDHAGVSKLMNDMDAGIFFIRPYYSKIASAPTKLGEFLGCGVPCLSNTGVGDMTRILEDNKVGVAIKDFEEISLKTGLEELIAISKSEGIRYHCRSVSLDLFSLDVGVRSYEQVYASLEGK